MENKVFKANQRPILELRNITKTFIGGKILANNKISLSFNKGEIHAIVGENGSGKSTLMNILFGLYKQDSGSIFINGEEVNMYSAGAAAKHKIGMVHQHYHLVDNFSVLDNILIGQENPKEEKDFVTKAKKDYLVKKERFSKYRDFLLDEEKKNLSKVIKLSNEISSKNLKRNKIKKKILDNEELLEKNFSKFKIQLIRNKIINLKKDFKLNSSEKFLNKQKELLKNNSVKKAFALYLVKRKAYLKFVGFKLTTITYINRKRALARFKLVTERYNITLDPKEKIRDLSVGARQMVEIIKILWQEKEIIVFDEPTAVLSVREIDALLQTVKGLRKQNKTIIFISHKLQEVKAIANKISILRKGDYLGTLDNNTKLSISNISMKMVGKDIDLKYPKRKISGNPILLVNNLSLTTSSGFKVLNNISFDVKEGEIFGLAGIEGNGQEEVLNILAGLVKPSSGEVIFKNEKWIETKDGHVKTKSIESRLKKYSHSPIDRNIHGMVPDKSLKFNSVLSSFDSAQYSKAFISLKDDQGYKAKYYNLKSEIKDIKSNIKKLEDSTMKQDKLPLQIAKKSLKKKENKLYKIAPKLVGKNIIMDLSSTDDWTSKIIRELNVDGAYENTIPIKNLSGGNQQKFVVGRELLKQHELLLAGHPTRGLDIAAINHIYKKIIKNTKGKATVLYSLELNELVAVCDRLAIFYKGKIVDIIDPRKYSMGQISRLLIGEK